LPIRALSFREPLLLPAAGLLSGVVAGRYAWVTPVEAAGLAALGLLLAWRGRSAAWRGFIIWVAAAGAGVLLEHTRRPAPPPVIAYEPNEALELRGCVVEPLVLAEGRARFQVELQPGARALVTLYPKEGVAPPVLRYGQRIRFHARLRPPDRFQNPGSFDYPAYLARRQVYWLANMVANRPVEVEPGACGSRWAGWIAGTRRALLDRLEGLYAGNEYQVGMMQAMLLGDSQKVQKVWTEDFRHTGTFHALVISGQHVAVLSAVLIFLVHRVLRRPMLAFVLAAAVAWMYALLAGATAPVVRSAAGLTLFLLARFVYREGRLLNVLAGVTIGFVLVDPGHVFEASFILSFLAVAAIGGLAAPVIDVHLEPYRLGLAGLANPDRDLHQEPKVQSFRVELRLAAAALGGRFTLSGLQAAWWLGLLAAETLVLSALLQAALALPGVLYFHRFSATGLTANLAVTPLLSVAVPTGFAAMLFNSSWLAAVAGSFLNAAGAVAAWHAPLEPAWRIPDPPWWLAFALALATVLWAIGLRRRRFVLVPALAALSALAVMVAHPFAPVLAGGALELTAVDVGQGDGLLLSTPGRQLIAIDAGGFPRFGRGGAAELPGRRRARLDVGEDVISPYFWTRSIQRLDVAVLTHAHSDHIGGLPALLDNFRPRELWTGWMPEQNEDWRAVREQAVRLGIRIRAPMAGERWHYGGADFEALAPYPDEVRERKRPQEAHNNDSLVLLVTHGRHRFLLTGDAESKVEGRMAAAWPGGRVDVLKVGHHGSRTSTSAALLDAFQPGYALVSCGRLNSFRHPNGRVIERLAARGVTVFRTDEQGLVTVRSDGRYLTWTQGAAGGLLPVF